MFANQVRINETLRSQAAAQLSAFQSVSEHVIEAAEKISALNVSAARAVFEQSQETFKALSQVKDFSGAIDVLSKAAGPLQAQAAEYQQAAGEIISDAGGQISKVAEAHASTVTEAASKFGADISSQAPFNAQQAATAVHQAVEAVHGNVAAFAEKAAGAVKAMQQTVSSGRSRRK